MKRLSAFGATLCLVALLSRNALAQQPGSARAPATTDAARTSVSLYIDGTFAASAFRVDGLRQFANVLSAATGTSAAHPDLRLANAYLEPLVVEVGQLSPPLLRWVTDSLNGDGPSHALRVVCRAEGATVWDLDAGATYLRAVTFNPPASAAPSSGPGGTTLTPTNWTVSVTFASTRLVNASDPPPTGSTSAGSAVSAQGPVALTLDGLGSARVMALAPVVITMGRPARGAGDHATPTTITPVVVTLRAADARPWASWAQAGLQGGAASEHDGSLTWQGSSLSLALRRVGASGVQWGMSTEREPTVTLSLYVEEVSFGAAPAGAASRGPAAAQSTGALGARRVGPFEVAVTGVETLASGLTVAEEHMTPTARERLVRVNYTLRNAGAEPEPVDSATLSFQAVDSAGAAFGGFQVGSGAELVRLTGLTLAPGETRSFGAVATIATRPVRSVRVTCASDGTSTTFQVP